MGKTIKLSDGLIEKARRYGDICSRSVPKQIEYWSLIGRIAEENPDISYNVIKDILLAKSEASDNDVTPYEFS